MIDRDRALIERLKAVLAISPQMADYLTQHWAQTAALLSAARQARTLEPGEGWEPIETARRNGEEVLVWGRSIGRQIASAKSVPRHEPYEWPSGWDFPTGATHWRPLPAPPASQIKEG